MQAGKLRHLVKLQSPAPGQDAAGQPVAAWADVAIVWADVRFIGGLEAVKAGAAVSVARCSIRIRSRVGVTAGMRVIEGAQVYDIRAVLPDPSGRQYLDLVAEIGANGG